jgi:hypothetical protein
MKKDLFKTLLLGSLATFSTSKLIAADAFIPDTSYGIFNTLDHRSGYGQGVFPEPFLVSSSDLETGELRLDWLHSANGSGHTDILHPEVEYAFGLLTLEVEAPYERNVVGGSTTSGMQNVDVGARYPLWQFVSGNGAVDTTFGIATEIGIPTNTALSHNTEIVPKFFNDTRLGNFSIQSVFGYSMLLGPGEEGGLDTFEYGFVFGYDIPNQTLALPGINKIIPVVELIGELPLNHDNRGQNSLTVDAGLRVNMKTICGIQPRPGIVFVLPVNSEARAESHWGIMSSLVFEF